ncbi:hypothetical protein [Streptomyces sp. VRA16 Mangrove soil]|uniref:hypothetical protein n=1 Tax=Streptomyces sp. VRA16 Mangrove soil TaxID=2817434 RepID=UPI001A9ED2EA|nr:hypothetical protein [Streptomyces sp. VRA16 Mangrove soil]MBO1332801.1 hypothetical protein [Streptomyces sp. VRA16 Mangrove soil]
MSNARRIRMTLTSAVLGLGAATALATSAGAATGPGPSSTQDMQLSDGSVAHVTGLGDGHYQAWITHDGTRIAALDPSHASARVHGNTYELNQANGFVGVIEASGWHSESDVARPGTDKHHENKHHEMQHHAKKGHAKQGHAKKGHEKKGHAAARQAIGATRSVPLPSGAVAHVTRLSPTQWQAWVTLKGVRVAALDNAHQSAHTHGWTYHLAPRTGTVTAHR